MSAPATAADVEWREREYSPSSAIGGNYAPYIDRYRTASASARQSVPHRRDVPYGNAPRQLLDFFPAPSPDQLAGLLVFIHGGYWQELSKDESAFLAPAWHAAGVAHAVVDYTLAPDANVGEIVEECRAAIGWLIEHAGELGVDRDRIVVAGSSAGAYLAAACGDLPLAGVVLVSGIYDLRPLIGTSINDALRLDAPSAAALDLFARPPSCPMVIGYGEIETAEFKRQSTAFAALADGVTDEVCVVEVEGRNHFDVVHELGEPSSELFARTERLVGRPTSATVDWPDRLHELLRAAGVGHVSYVPDAGHTRLIERCIADPSMRTNVLTTEEEGVAIAAGAWLGGLRSVVLMQSSGVGNCINMLSLPVMARIPLLMLVTMRGEWGEFNPWQNPMSRATQASLEAIGVRVVRAETAEDLVETVAQALTMVFEADQQIAVLIGQRLLGRKQW